MWIIVISFQYINTRFWGFSPVFREKKGFFHEPVRSIMFDISENGREAVVSYLNRTFKDKRNMKPATKKYENELDKPIKKIKLRNLILTKSLIVKL